MLKLNSRTIENKTKICNVPLYKLFSMLKGKILINGLIYCLPSPICIKSSSSSWSLMAALNFSLWFILLYFQLLNGLFSSDFQGIQLFVTLIFPLLFPTCTFTPRTMPSCSVINSITLDNSHLPRGM